MASPTHPTLDELPTGTKIPTKTSPEYERWQKLAILVGAAIAIVIMVELVKTGEGDYRFVCPLLPDCPATLTQFTSYPACCVDQPNYDPSASTEECTAHSNACESVGVFDAFKDPVSGEVEIKSYEWVASNNLVSFFVSEDADGKHWRERYANRQIRLTAGGKTFDATIVHTCHDDYCGSPKCCRAMAGTSGFLVDIEYWTLVNNLDGNVNVTEDEITYEILW
jgi:hypothetical protein